MWKWKWRSGWCFYKPRKAKFACKPSEAERQGDRRCTLTDLRRNQPSRHLDLGLQDCETINFCCLSHSVALGYLSHRKQTRYHFLFWCPNYPSFGHQMSGGFCILSTWPHPSLCMSLLSGTTRCTRLTLNFCCPVLRMSPIFKEPWFLLVVYGT